jgi:competence protein ComEA
MNAPAPSKPPIRPSWPRPVQWALAFVLGVAATLIVGRIALALMGNSPRPTERQAAAPPLDLNQATKADLLQLPGIGENLADAILAARESRGGFRQVDDLREVHGIGPARLEKLRPYVRVEPPVTATVSVTSSAPASTPRSSSPGKKTLPANTRVDLIRASATELQRLPGVGPVLSDRIIQQREKAPFRTVDELRKVSGIGAKTLEKLRPHVTVGETASDTAAKAD